MIYLLDSFFPLPLFSFILSVPPYLQKLCFHIFILLSFFLPIPSFLSVKVCACDIHWLQPVRSERGGFHSAVCPSCKGSRENLFLLQVRSCSEWRKASPASLSVNNRVHLCCWPWTPQRQAIRISSFSDSHFSLFSQSIVNYRGLLLPWLGVFPFS